LLRTHLFRLRRAHARQHPRQPILRPQRLPRVRPISLARHLVGHRLRFPHPPPHSPHAAPVLAPPPPTQSCASGIRLLPNRHRRHHHQIGLDSGRGLPSGHQSPQCRHVLCCHRRHLQHLHG